VSGICWCSGARDPAGGVAVCGDAQLDSSEYATDFLRCGSGGVYDVASTGTDGQVRLWHIENHEEHVATGEARCIGTYGTVT